MAHLDLPAILTGVAADQAIVRSDIMKLEALMADTHLSQEDHDLVQNLLNIFLTWRHVLEGLHGRVRALQDLGYPTYPSAELFAAIKARILAELQAEEDIIDAERDAINKLFTTPAIVMSGTIDFDEPIAKRG